MRLPFVLEIGSPVLGVGFAGSLATSRPKVGEHRFRRRRSGKMNEDTLFITLGKYDIWHALLALLPHQVLIMTCPLRGKRHVVLQRGYEIMILSLLLMRGF